MQARSEPPDDAPLECACTLARAVFFFAGMLAGIGAAAAAAGYVIDLCQ